MDEVVDRYMMLYDELLPFAKFLARKFQSGDILVSQEDVVGELLVEFVKAYNRYQDKGYVDIIKISKTMMNYRVSELRYRYYVTSRKNSITDYSLDLDEVGEDIPQLHETVADDTLPLECQYEGIQFWNDLLEAVSSTTRDILNLIMVPNARLVMLLKTSEMRAEYVNKNGCKNVSIKPKHIADALFIDEEQVMLSYKEACNIIQDMYERGE